MMLVGKIAVWTTGYGSQTMSPVLAAFRDDGVTYIVIRVARMRYDVNEPFAVLRADSCVSID